jgi:hypothetical protein
LNSVKYDMKKTDPGSRPLSRHQREPKSFFVRDEEDNDADFRAFAAFGVDSAAGDAARAAAHLRRR